MSCNVGKSYAKAMQSLENSLGHHMAPTYEQSILNHSCTTARTTWTTLSTRRTITTSLQSSHRSVYNLHCRVVCKSKNLSMKASSCTCSDNICPTSVPWRYHGIYDASTYHERAPAKTTPSHQQLRSSLNLYLAMLPEV